MCGCLSMIIRKGQLTFIERYNTAVEEFYECFSEIFSGESNKRPVVDWI